VRFGWNRTAATAGRRRPVCVAELRGADAGFGQHQPHVIGGRISGDRRNDRADLLVPGHHQEGWRHP
jgi:hypothetical protein